MSVVDVTSCKECDELIEVRRKLAEAEKDLDYAMTGLAIASMPTYGCGDAMGACAIAKVAYDVLSKRRRHAVG